MKRLLTSVFIILLSLPIALNGQSSIGFAYDAAGNRVKREIVVSQNQNSPAHKLHNTDSFFDKLGGRTVQITLSQNGVIDVHVIDYLPNDECNIEVYSINGTHITQVLVSNAVTSIDISDQTSGVYLLNVRLNGILTTWKIFKR